MASTEHDTTPSAPVERTVAGKRYRCSVCGVEVICTRAGNAPLRCHDEDMVA